MGHVCHFICAYAQHSMLAVGWGAVRTLVLMLRGLHVSYHPSCIVYFSVGLFSHSCLGRCAGQPLTHVIIALQAAVKHIESVDTILHIDSLFSIDQCGYTHVNALVTSGHQLVSSNVAALCISSIHEQQFTYSWHASRHLILACQPGAGSVVSLLRPASVHDLLVCRYLH